MEWVRFLKTSYSEQYTSMIGFRWSIKHPEEGKIVDMNQSIREDTGVQRRLSLKIYPISGYGNQELVRQLINIEKPDPHTPLHRPTILGLVISNGT